jgi:hypothetical protein
VIIGVLQELTIEAGMCIICSIHQPSSQVYSQFDDLCFLDAGRCVYFGKAGNAAIDYFQSLTNMTCPSQYNPPDWFMEQAVRGKLSGVKMDVRVANDFHAGDLDMQDPGFAVPFGEQVSVIFQRSWVKTKVAKLNTPFYMQQIAIGVIMGILFVGLGNKEADIFSRVSFAFNFLMGSLYLPVMEVHTYVTVIVVVVLFLRLRPLDQRSRLITKFRCYLFSSKTRSRFGKICWQKLITLLHIT